MKRQRRMTFCPDTNNKNNNNNNRIYIPQIILEEESVQRKIAREFVNKIIIISQYTINHANSK